MSQKCNRVIWFKKKSLGTVPLEACDLVISRVTKYGHVELGPLGLLSLNLGGRALSQTLEHS